MADINPRAFIILIILIFYFNNSSDTQRPLPPVQPIAGDDASDDHEAVLALVNATQYGDFNPAEKRWLNWTGFREDDGYSWDLLNEVRKRAIEQAQYVLEDTAEKALGDELMPEARPVLFRNVTGRLAGEWTLSQIGQGVSRSPLNITHISANSFYDAERFDRNITAKEGKVDIELQEGARGQQDPNDATRQIKATIFVEDTRFGTPWNMNLHGVHFLNSGHILLTTTSSKFSGVFALPHLVLTDKMYPPAQERSYQMISDSYSNDYRPHLGYWSSMPEGSSDLYALAPHCDFVVYLQQHPIVEPRFTTEVLEFVETELRFPTGAPLGKLPRMAMSMTAYSPDCGFVIESRGPPRYHIPTGGHLRGSKREVQAMTARRAAEMIALIFVAQLFLFMKQMRDTSTPSTRHRISYYTIGILAFGDGYIAVMSLLVFGIMQASVYYTAFATFFLGLPLSVMYLCLRFILDIWAVQYTEQLRQERQENGLGQQGNSADNPNQPPAPESNALPLPVTANRGDTGATPIIMPFDQDLDSPIENTATPSIEESTEAYRRVMYMQFVFIMLVQFIAAVFVLSFPPFIRSFVTNVGIFLYLSCWCPQINRNIVRNCRKALRWDFVVGQSILRLIPVFYAYAIEGNVLGGSTDVFMLYVLIAWVWLQIMVLWSQEHLGPRFFVPDGWAPPAYDYHPILRDDEEEMNLPIGSDESVGDADASTSASKKAGESRDKGKRVYDCTICAQDIEVPVVPAGTSQDGLAANLLTRRTYMVTPCRHIFHTTCLEGWMRYRLQCPNCRETLPPL